MSKIGLIAELTKKQQNRDYFSDIPIGTKFIIVDEINLPAYDLTGYFLNYPPQFIEDGTYHFLGYIERNSWRIIGELKNNIEILKK